MILNPILKVLPTLGSHRVRYLLIGGQACVLYGAAEFSRDTEISTGPCFVFIGIIHSNPAGLNNPKSAGERPLLEIWKRRRKSGPSLRKSGVWWANDDDAWGWCRGESNGVGEVQVQGNENPVST